MKKIEQAIAEIKAGKMIIVVDDENRENEGDLFFAAEFVDKEKINFMIKYCRGLVCMPITAEMSERLNIRSMVTKNEDPKGTAFTVSVDAAVKFGITTGISAADRAKTIEVILQDNSRSEDINRPGHIFPLIAKEGGVLKRAGHTEAAIDFSRLAGLKPAGVICEIIKDNGEMARMADLEIFAKEHGLNIYTIKDLITYRIKLESLIEKTGEVGVVDALTWREKVFCLYCLEYDEVKGEFVCPDEEMRNFGDTAVVITNAKEFLNRIERALKARFGNSFWWAYKRVLYNVNLSKDFKYSEFCKAAPYSYQNEFRIALDLSQNKFTDTMLNAATDFAKIELARLLNGREWHDENPDSIEDTLTINIGNIRDICEPMPISELLYLKHNVLKGEQQPPEHITQFDNTRKPRPTLCRPICAIPLEGESYTLGFGVSHDEKKIWLNTAVL